MDSIIKPHVEAYASNLHYDNDEVIDYDDLIDDHHQALLDAHPDTCEQCGHYLASNGSCPEGGCK